MKDAFGTMEIVQWHQDFLRPQGPPGGRWDIGLYSNGVGMAPSSGSDCARARITHSFPSVFPLVVALVEAKENTEVQSSPTNHPHTTHPPAQSLPWEWEQSVGSLKES